jgi:hypothetical protein
MPSTNTPNSYGTGWKKAKAEAFIDLECPTGTWAQVRKPNPRSLIALGFVDRLDTLNGIIQSKHITRVKGSSGGSQIDPKALLKNPAALMGMLELCDRVCEHVVVQPTVVRPVKVVGTTEDGQPIEVKLPGEERDPEVIYTDEMDDADKMFIFNHAAGGDPDLATFRDLVIEPTAVVGNVEQVANKTKRVSRNRK